jgi:hypothetical protein
MNTNRPGGKPVAWRSRLAVFLAAVTASALATLVLAQASALGAGAATRPGRSAVQVLGSTAPGPGQSPALRAMPLRG